MSGFILFGYFRSFKILISPVLSFYLMLLVMLKKVTSLLSVQPHFKDGRYSRLKIKLT